jgi:hypothetical protein
LVTREHGFVAVYFSRGELLAKAGWLARPLRRVASEFIDLVIQ